MDALGKVARVGQIIMGIVYMITGAIKVLDLEAFFWLIVPYVRMFNAPFGIATLAAKLTTILGPVEFVLGVALVLNWRPRLCLPMATGLMAAFTALMTLAWHLGASVDCGCFGDLLERSPGEAAIEDGLMLLVLLFAWWGLRRRDQAGPPAEGANWWGLGGAPVWPSARRLVVVASAAALVIGGVRFLPEIGQLVQPKLKVGVELTDLTPRGVDVDLMQGEYLIEMFSPTCKYCVDAVPKMNLIAEDPDLPPLVALTNFPPENEKLVDFKDQLQPRFSIGTIPEKDFMLMLVGHGGVPLLAYIKDGKVELVLDDIDLEKEPAEVLAEIKQALANVKERIGS